MDTILNDILEAALIGYRKLEADTAAKIAEIEAQLRGKKKGNAGSPAAPKTSRKKQKRGAGRPAGAPSNKRRLSKEGRAKIAAATKKRWAAYRKEKGLVA